jgi:hypothetical protein
LIKPEEQLLEGQRYVVRYDGKVFETITVDAPFVRPASFDLDISVTVDGYLSSRVELPDAAAANQSLFFYSAMLDGEALESLGGGSTFVGLCDDNRIQDRGWHEFAVDLSLLGVASTHVLSVVDVWVDCEAAKRGEHPSIVKSPEAWFDVP